MRTRACRVAIALLSLSVPAAGQTLSEADALARLSSDSPRVRAIRAAADLARADVLAAGRWPNPRATYNREAVAGVTENMWTVTQSLPITGRRGLEVSAASALADARTRRADDEIRRARLELRTAYANLVSAQVREATLARSHDRLQELAGILAKRETAGDAAGYDRIRAEREAMDLEGEVSVARADRVRAQAALAEFFADPGDITSLVAVVPTDPARPPVPALEGLVDRAVSIRGEPAALRDEIEKSATIGEQAARKAHVRISPFDPAEQARFDALYLVDARANARALAGLGIDGLDVFRKARASIKPNSLIECGGAA